jgi:hypothetical protein
MARVKNLVPSKEQELRNKVDRVNPYEFKNGLDLEASKKGYSCFAKMEDEDRKASLKVVETVVKNLEKYPAYYSVLAEYEGKKTGGQFNEKAPTFNSYLKKATEQPNDQMEKVKLKESAKSIAKKLINENLSDKWDSLSDDEKFEYLSNAVKDPDDIEDLLDKEYNELGSVVQSNIGLNEIHDGVTAEKVIKIYNELKEKGETPTEEKIIELLDSDVKNPQYIKAILDRHKDKLKESFEDLVKEVIQEVKSDMKKKEAKDIKGIEKSVGATKSALSNAMSEIKSLAKYFKSLKKDYDTQLDKIQAKLDKNDITQDEYEVQKDGINRKLTADSKVKRYVKIRKMLKDAGFLNQ